MGEYSPFFKVPVRNKMKRVNNQETKEVSVTSVSPCESISDSVINKGKGLSRRWLSSSKVVRVVFSNRKFGT